jgi:type I restriction enzyme M protein
MFVQSEKFIEAHGGRVGDVSIYGQESNQTTWRLCKMNLTLRGIESDLVKWNGQGSFLNDEHKDLRADFILANPPFNDSDWAGELLQDDVRWKFGVPPRNNANFAWVQHFIHHLSPSGIAGFVLANGSMSSSTSNEGEIRKNIIEADLVECMVALPSQLFYNTMIPACLWFVSRGKKNHKFHDRRGQVLFIDGRKLGTMVDRRHRELTRDDIKNISDTYHAWRGESDKKYSDVAGFCKSTSLGVIREQGWILTPGRYVGTEDEEEDDSRAFDEKMKHLTSELSNQMRRGQKLDDEIKKNLKIVGYEI